MDPRGNDASMMLTLGKPLNERLVLQSAEQPFRHQPTPDISILEVSGKEVDTKTVATPNAGTRRNFPKMQGLQITIDDEQQDKVDTLKINREASGNSKSVLQPATDDDRVSLARVNQSF